MPTSPIQRSDMAPRKRFDRKIHREGRPRRSNSPKITGAIMFVLFDGMATCHTWHSRVFGSQVKPSSFPAVQVPLSGAAAIGQRLEFQERPQLTALFTSALILASSVAVNSFRAKTTGHMAPSSRFAESLKPSVAYRVLNFCAGWKKQTTSPSLAYAGIPYQVLGERAGPLALMIAWSRLAMARSGAGISAIFASTSLSPSTLSARGPRRASAFSSWARSFIAARSSSVNPVNFLLTALLLLADFWVSFFGLIET